MFRRLAWRIGWPASVLLSVSAAALALILILTLLSWMLLQYRESAGYDRVDPMIELAWPWLSGVRLLAGLALIGLLPLTGIAAGWFRLVGRHDRSKWL